MVSVKLFPDSPKKKKLIHGHPVGRGAQGLNYTEGRYSVDAALKLHYSKLTQTKLMFANKKV